VYERAIGRRTYQELSDGWMAGVGLGVRLWDGVFEGRTTRWLRWYDAQGYLIPTGAERAEQERQRAEQERQRAEQERQRAEQSELAREQERQCAEQERQRAEQLVAQLRALGIEPDLK